MVVVVIACSESMEMCLDADSPLTTAVLPCTKEFYLSHYAQVYTYACTYTYS